MNAIEKISPAFNLFKKLTQMMVNANRAFCYFVVVAILMSAWALTGPIFELSEWITNKKN